MKGRNEFINSLSQKYNAVCFDIDGTLTQENSIHLEENAIYMIGDLIKHKIPVVFITGRGETGLNNLKNDLFGTLNKKYRLYKKDLMRIYILTNDGAKLYQTSEDSIDKIWDKEIYISTKDAFEQLNKFNDYIKDNQEFNELLISYSTDRNNILLNIRFIFDNETELTKTLDNLNNTIIKENLDKLNITRGVFEGKTVLQIGTSKKEKAIELAEKIIGVPENSMIRIGDCGDENGNDYSMLNCEQGYSVDKISSDQKSCFPIVDNLGNVLKGVEATKYLIKTAKLLPTVCLEKADKETYYKDYAKIEAKINNRKDSFNKKLEQVIDSNFNLINGHADLFDKNSGSIKIPMYEWALINDDNPLKKLFNKEIDKNLIYSLRDNKNFLLRGSKTYYYFLANRKSSENNDYTSPENVIEWYKNNLTFINDAYNAVTQTNNLNDITNKKMILGILDNIRNSLLILLHSNIVSNYDKDNILINLSNTNNSQIRLLNSLNSLNDRMMANICFNENYKIEKNDILGILKDSKSTVTKNLDKFKEKVEEKDYSKEYRTYREIDNFAENYINLYLTTSDEYDTSVCGMAYGGEELSIIYKIIHPQVQDVCILKFNKEVSGYKNKQLIELRKFDIENYNGIRVLGDISNKNIMLMDDNILSGKTIQLAINSLYDIGFKTKGVNIVRYPSINRIDQMFMENHSAVDYKLFFDYINGLNFSSPYSWRDENKFDIYKDSLGVFDLNRKKIIECLVKNHDYTKDSEVAEYISNRISEGKQKQKNIDESL
ncbi:MAG: HAD family phosphatase [Bacilli bacterium]|nr:HAD family phosphatase [Bacilli bacterium]MBR3049621.1 HAD family phosphatase [Bacilli bacterium]